MITLKLAEGAHPPPKRSRMRWLGLLDGMVDAAGLKSVVRKGVGFKSPGGQGLISLG